MINLDMSDDELFKHEMEIRKHINELQRYVFSNTTQGVDGSDGYNVGVAQIKFNDMHKYINDTFLAISQMRRNMRK